MNAGNRKKKNAQNRKENEQYLVAWRVNQVQEMLGYLESRLPPMSSFFFLGGGIASLARSDETFTDPTVPTSM